MKPWVVTLSCILAAFNLLAFVFWFSLARIQATTPPAGVTVYDAISLQITILSLIVASVAFGLAIVGVFGYQAIRTTLLEHAERLVNAHLESLKPKPGMEQNTPTDEPPHDPGAAPPVEETNL